MRRLVIILFLLVCAGVAGGGVPRVRAAAADADDVRHRHDDHARAADAGRQGARGGRALRRRLGTRRRHRGGAPDRPSEDRGERADREPQGPRRRRRSRRRSSTCRRPTIGARATIDVTWQVPGFGPLALRHGDPAAPARERRLEGGLDAEDHLRRSSRRTPASAPSATSRNARRSSTAPAREILGDRPVVDVGLERDKVTNVTASATALAKLRRHRRRRR